VGGEVVAHVFDEVAIHVVAGVDAEGTVVVRGGGYGVSDVLGRGERGVGDVGAIFEEAAVEFEKLAEGTGVGGRDARVGDLFAQEGLAFAGGDAGVLEVDVVGVMLSST
jgi:hypothetical protein